MSGILNFAKEASFIGSLFCLKQAKQQIEYDDISLFGKRSKGRKHEMDHVISRKTGTENRIE